jgi:rhodanese-related sulfurtransferase
MIILDVREKDEFEAEHIPESIHCPLSQFDLHAPGILRSLKNEEVLLICRSGNRAQMALNELSKHQSQHLSFRVYEGGIQKWKSEGKSVQGKGSGIPVLRQMQIVASSMIFLAFLGAAFVHPNFVYLALFVGFGLALSGFTGFCPMVFLLQKMPWNTRSAANCNVTKKSCCD